MSYCNICGNNFIKKSSLVKHLTERRCKGDLVKVNELYEENNRIIEKLLKELCDNTDAKILNINANGNNNTINNINIKVEIQINPIVRLEIEDKSKLLDERK
jgi:hypothetical protein